MSESLTTDHKENISNSTNHKGNKVKNMGHKDKL